MSIWIYNTEFILASIVIAKEAIIAIITNVILYFFNVVTTKFVDSYPAWVMNRAAGQPFTIKATVIYPEETVLYPLIKISFQLDNFL